jgi:hypothetical protein
LRKKWQKDVVEHCVVREVARKNKENYGCRKWWTVFGGSLALTERTAALNGGAATAAPTSRPCRVKALETSQIDCLLNATIAYIQKIEN